MRISSTVENIDVGYVTTALMFRLIYVFIVCSQIWRK